jgi:hypothetical protein
MKGSLLHVLPSSIFSVPSLRRVKQSPPQRILRVAANTRLPESLNLVMVIAN